MNKTSVYYNLFLMFLSGCAALGVMSTLVSLGVSPVFAAVTVIAAGVALLGQIVGHAVDSLHPKIDEVNNLLNEIARSNSLR